MSDDYIMVDYDAQPGVELELEFIDTRCKVSVKCLQ